ncbi:hypothetical protein C5S31_10145 [ANME-1 cluster archaeon GoMg2]|nr:hypothetical protein [ANME-1 cluster archaeon GoMg2]
MAQKTKHTTMRNARANVGVPHAGTADRKRLDKLH